MPKGYGRAAVYDKTLGTVHVWSPKGALPTPLAELIDARVNRIVHRRDEWLAVIPTAVDWYVITSARSSAHIRKAGELISSRYGPIVLPEAGPWLREKLAARVATGCDVDVWVG